MTSKHVSGGLILALAVALAPSARADTLKTDSHEIVAGIVAVAAAVTIIVIVVAVHYSKKRAITGCVGLGSERHEHHRRKRQESLRAFRQHDGHQTRQSNKAAGQESKFEGRRPDTGMGSKRGDPELRRLPTLIRPCRCFTLCRGSWPTTSARRQTENASREKIPVAYPRRHAR